MFSEQNGTLQINIQTNVIYFVSGLNTTISSFLYVLLKFYQDRY